MNISRATYADIAQIAALQNKLLLPVENPENGFLVSAFSENEYRNFIDKYEYFYVAKVDDVVTGVLMAYKSEHVAPHDSNNMLIKSTVIGDFILVKQIFISPDLSSKGVARRLYMQLFDDAGRELPYVCAIVTEPFNKRSNEFHKRLGFVEYLNFTPVADKDGVVRGRSVWMLPPAESDGIVNHVRLTNVCSDENDLGDVMSNRMTALISLYQHEDNLNWTKFGMQTTILFALFASFAYFNDKAITDAALPVLTILGLWGVIVNVLFMLKIDSGIRYMNTYKRKIQQYDNALTFYFPKATRIFCSHEFISRRSITCKLMYTFSVIGLVSWICVVSLLLLKVLRVCVLF